MAPRFSWLWLPIAASVLLCSAGAEAQQWLSDRQRAEGHGIRAGDFELHPGIGAEVGWVNNVLLSTPEQASAALRVSPHLYLSTLGAERLEGSNQKVGFRAGVNGSFRDYFQTALKPNVAVG